MESLWIHKIDNLLDFTFYVLIQLKCKCLKYIKATYKIRLNSMTKRAREREKERVDKKWELGMWDEEEQRQPQLVYDMGYAPCKASLLPFSNVEEEAAAQKEEE